MTLHYSNLIGEIDPELILDGWYVNGCKLPGVYAMTCQADRIAYNCWQYLALLENPEVYLELWGFVELPSVDKFLERSDVESRVILKPIIEEVINLWRKR